MIDITTPQPIKDLVYCCQSLLYWHDEYASEMEWTALRRENDFLERIRDLTPMCLDLIKNDVGILDCE